jgi:hypothetical protein
MFSFYSSELIDRDWQQAGFIDDFISAHCSTWTALCQLLSWHFPIARTSSKTAILLM